MIRRPPRSTPFPYTPLSRSAEPPPAAARLQLGPHPADALVLGAPHRGRGGAAAVRPEPPAGARHLVHPVHRAAGSGRSEEHTSELQSRLHLVCRLLLEKKKN